MGKSVCDRSCKDRMPAVVVQSAHRAADGSPVSESLHRLSALPRPRGIAPFTGGGLGWGPGRKPAQDHVAHASRIAHYLVVPESQHPETAGAQEGIARGVARRTAVLPAIDLQQQASLRAGEVGDVRAHRELAAEAVARQLAHAQARPEPALGIGHVAPQLAGAVPLLALTHPCVSPVASSISSVLDGRSGIRGSCGRLSESSSPRLAPTPTLPRSRGRELKQQPVLPALRFCPVSTSDRSPRFAHSLSTPPLPAGGGRGGAGGPGAAAHPPTQKPPSLPTLQAKIPPSVRLQLPPPPAGHCALHGWRAGVGADAAAHPPTQKRAKPPHYCKPKSPHPSASSSLPRLRGIAPFTGGGLGWGPGAATHPPTQKRAKPPHYCKPKSPPSVRLQLPPPPAGHCALHGWRAGVGADAAAPPPKRRSSPSLPTLQAKTPPIRPPPAPSPACGALRPSRVEGWGPADAAGPRTQKAARRRPSTLAVQPPISR